MSIQIFHAVFGGTETVVKARSGGFTLMEIMLSVMVLSVGLLAIGSMQVKAINGNLHATRLTEGSTWAQNTIERLMSLPYGDQALQDTTSYSGETEEVRRNSLRHPLPPLSQQPIPDPETYPPEHQAREEMFTIHWNVEDNLEQNNAKSIAVVVTWAEGSVQRAVVIESVRPRIF
jgi:type IV pilus assembly protein PilV